MKNDQSHSPNPKLGAKKQDDLQRSGGNVQDKRDLAREQHSMHQSSRQTGD